MTTAPAHAARQRRQAERDAARAADLRWMADTGECAEGAARRLGIAKLDALRVWCVRHGLEDVWDTLHARDPRDWNRNAGNQWRRGAA